MPTHRASTVATIAAPRGLPSIGVPQGFVLRESHREQITLDRRSPRITLSVTPNTIAFGFAACERMRELVAEQPIIHIRL